MKTFPQKNRWDPWPFRQESIALRRPVARNPLSPATDAPGGGGVRRAFSLIELLVVMALIAIFSSMAVVAFSGIQRSSGLTRAGSALADTIALARQQAASRNRLVELRIIGLPGAASPSYTAFQLYTTGTNGMLTAPASKIERFPNGIEVADESALSPLLSSTNGTLTNSPLGANLPWKGLTFRPDGTLGGSVSGTNNFITLRHFSDTASPPKNYFTIRVNPINGRITTHRP